MLHKISVENFFSIADKQELDFTVADNAPDLPCFIPSRSDANIRLPVVVGFFGPNASGKSTILRALIAAALFATNSVTPGENNILFFQPYRKKEWWDKPTKIIIEFDSHLSESAPSNIFRYELQITHDHQDMSKKQVLYEALSYAPEGRFRSLFKREEQSMEFGSDFNISKGDTKKESVRKDASVISTFAMLNHSISGLLKKLTQGLRTNIHGLLIPQLLASQYLRYYFNNKKAFEELRRELRKFDMGIEAIDIDQGPQGLFATCGHIGLDEPILIGEESQGTQRFIEMFRLLHYALETGGIAVIDEIDSDLHPLLLPELLSWFKDAEKNPKNAQLFFTAHNSALLDELEKEQVYFAEKSYGKSTSIYGAKDIKGLRREPSLMRKYLLGELGATPTIG